MAIIATAIAVTACGEMKELTPAESLLEQLSDNIANGKIMFGHQDTYLYGLDLGGIELDSPLNIDKNDFNHMRTLHQSFRVEETQIMEKVVNQMIVCFYNR